MTTEHNEKLALDYTPDELDHTAPPRIWLQIDPGDPFGDRSAPWPGSEGVTWQDESVGGLEIQYVRADLAAQPAAAQEAVPYGYVFTDDPEKFAMPGGGFHLGPVQPKDAINVIPLYAAPVTAAPADTWFADQLTAMGEVIPLDSTPAATVDLTNWAVHYSINPAAVEALQSMLARTPAAPVDADEDAYVIDQMGKLLAEIAVIVNGPEPAGTRWSYHDLPAKVKALDSTPAAPAGVQIGEWQGNDLVNSSPIRYAPGVERGGIPDGTPIYASTPAAPGIDRCSLLDIVAWWNAYTGPVDEALGEVIRRIRALIDANPKGALNEQFGSAEGLDSPKGGSEARDAARYRWLREFAVNGSIGIPFHGWLNCDEPASEWDSAIDDAMQAGDAEVQP